MIVYAPQLYQTDCRHAHLNATAGYHDGPACLDPVEEVLLHWVVIEGSVDVDWSDGGVVHTRTAQQVLGVKLSLQEYR